ncbi:DUF4214 domain-containing protein [Massilia sp. H6]|uniref:DUF4214 domain-containing protein n=1 Tax=Massilia sp. H6 TaxID=2970464 RepID=UPI0021692365|nr:DUF4214 domain-containing protein [Massilia sp. H6]UVW28628.1 DUF4214 domain-containing protein [Massilia sp. H6]
MATVAELTNLPLSGYQHIDALLDKGPHWNFITGLPANTLYYTFSITSGTEAGKTGQEAFTLAQQNNVRIAFDELRALTGIEFVETSNGAAAQIHLCNIDITSSNTVGLCSWQGGYSFNPVTNEVVSYNANAWVYLDNAEWRMRNRDLTPGTEGYETLLHELGHAVGLKHPFEGDIVLSAGQDNAGNTLMTYAPHTNNHAEFSPYDIAALKWIYGGDGLGGALGFNASTEAIYLTGTNSAETLVGTAFNDTLQGNGGNDVINGGDGNDTAVFTGVRNNYNITSTADGNLTVTSAAEGIDTLISIEQLRFADMTVERAMVIDSVPPEAPSFAVTKNAKGYTTGNNPLITGVAEANSTVKIYLGQTLIATTTAGANGVFKVTGSTLPDGTDYRVYATATDSAGNVSATSGFDTFNVDGKAPTAPTNTYSLDAGGNKPVFSGSGEAGTSIVMVHAVKAIEIGRTTVGADGRWTLASDALPNGDYVVGASSVDIADNVTSATTRMNFTIASSANQTGGAGNDKFIVGAGDNAIDGGAGVDTAIYAGSSANYTVARAIWGYTVAAKSGTDGKDTLINVERIQFSDGFKAIDIDGIGGQAYRLYEAALGRPAEKAGLGYWMWRMEGGTSLVTVAQEFTQQPEFAAIYGAAPTDAQFLRQLYLNILDREPDAAGYEYWVGRIESSSRAQIMVEFSEGFENQAQVIGTISGGMDYTPWV